MVQQTVCWTKKNVCILTVHSNMFVLPTDFPLGNHEKFSEFIPGTVLWSGGNVVFLTATSLLMASLLLSTYHTALHECVYFLCQVIQAVDRKTVILVLTSENCAEHKLLAQYLQCLWGSGLMVS